MAKTNWQMDDTVMPQDMNDIGQEINDLKADGSVTDDRIGDRTISDTTAPTVNTSKLSSLLNGIAHMIKAITGKSSWRTAPATTLEAAKGHMDNTTVHITAAERTGWNAKASTSIATTSANGLLSSVDKSKLDGIASGANNYTHPSTHPASIIVQDESNRFVTDTEKTTWNSKASTASATSTAAGLMSVLDKTKLDGIASGAQVNTVASVAGRTGAITLAKSDVGLANVDNVQQAPISHVGAGGTAHAAATATAAGFMAAADKAKLDGVASGANNYTHPSTHPASIIAQDASNRFVSDAEKSAWNSKASTAAATASTNGLMSSSDKSKLDGIVAGAQPNPGAATTATAGLMSSADKGKLDGIAAGAQVNPGAATASAAGLMSATDKSKLDGIAAGAQANPGAATASAAGLMSAADKGKLDGIVAGAQVNPGAATASAAGLMAAADKGKLDGIAAGAQVNRTISTQAQAIAGADNTTDMTPLRVREAIDARTRYGTTAGSATALTLALSPAPAALYTGLQVTVKLHVATGTNPTLNVNSLGAKALYDADGARFSGESGKIYSFVYDGTNFIQASGGGGGKLNVYTGLSEPVKKEGVWHETTHPINNIMLDTNVWNANQFTSEVLTFPTSITTSSLNDSSAIGCNGKMYIWGGGLGAYMFRYNEETETWTQLSGHTGNSQYNPSMTVHGADIYSFCGSSATAQTLYTTHLKFNTISNTWSVLPGANGRLHVIGGVDSGKIYYFQGGNLTGNPQSVALRFDIASGTWENLSSCPITSAGSIVSMYNGYAYAFGAITGTLLARFKISTNTWETVSLTSGSFSNGGSKVYTEGVQIGRYIYSQGLLSGTYETSIFDLETLNNTIIPFNDTVRRDCRAGFAHVGNKIYVVSTFLSSHSIYTFSLVSKVYPTNTLIILRSDNFSGKYQTELCSPTKFEGTGFGRLLTSFDDTSYYDGTKHHINIPTYYGDGSSWVKYK